MMAVKVLLLVTLVMALGHGLAEKCTRRDYLAMPRREEVPHCGTPQQFPVQLPVPPGFDYVLPNVVNLQQCTGLSCGFRKKCLPTPDGITTKTYKLHAFRAEHGDKPHCTGVQVEVHGACECRCVKTDCPYDNMILDKESCECECDQDSKEQCEKRQQDERQGGGEALVMWVESTCTCMCNRPKNCDGSMMWVPAKCRCVRKSELGIWNEI